MKPLIYGADYSVYVRVARLVLMEKGVEHVHVPVDVFATSGPPEWYREHHPFGRIPAFSHADLHLYETCAITRYVDEAFDGPALQPIQPRQRAAMNQIVGIVDAYAYKALVWGVYVERVSKPLKGAKPNEKILGESLQMAMICLSSIAELKGRGPYLIGNDITLADLYLAPVIAYFILSPEGQEMVQKFDSLREWWHRVTQRSSFAATHPTS